MKIPDDAFEYYVGLGTVRSHEAVANHYGASKRGITKRATAERWTERLAAIEEKARQRTDEKLVGTLTEMRERHIKTVRVIHAKAIQGLKELPITSGMEAIKAAELAIKLERLVAGEPSEHTQVSVEEVIKQEMHDLLVPASPWLRAQMPSAVSLATSRSGLAPSNCPSCGS